MAEQGTPPVSWLRANLFMSSAFFPETILVQVDQITANESQYAEIQNLLCNLP